MIITMRGKQGEDVEGIARELMRFLNIEQGYSVQISNEKNIMKMPHAMSKGHADILVTNHPNAEKL